MNKKMFFSLMLCGCVALSFVMPSFAQNTTVPAEPVVTNTTADTKADDATAKPKKAHKHHKKGVHKGKKGIGKKGHKKVETEKTTDVVENSAAPVKVNN